jgi:hypothetical protein
MGTRMKSLGEIAWGSRARRIAAGRMADLCRGPDCSGGIWPFLTSRL